MDQKKKYKGYLLIYLFIVMVSKKKKNVYTYDSSGSTAAFSLWFRPN